MKHVLDSISSLSKLLQDEAITSPLLKSYREVKHYVIGTFTNIMVTFKIFKMICNEIRFEKIRTEIDKVIVDNMKYRKNILSLRTARCFAIKVHECFIIFDDIILKYDSLAKH